MATAGSIPFDVAQQNVERIGINFSELPQMPFWAPLLGRNESVVRRAVTAKVMAGSALVGRELTQPEKDALAQHYAQLLRTKAFDSPFAIASSYAMFRRTRASYGFPFFTPKPEKFDPNSFPLFSMKGPRAQMAWHALRVAAWYGVCKFAAGVFFISYGISVHEKNYATDPRLQNYRQDATARAQQLSQQRAQLINQRLSSSKQPPPTGWAGAEQSTQDPSGTQPTWSGKQSPQAEGPASYSDESYVFDDASPVSPAEQQGASTQQQGTQGRSAWDRIRSQARGGGAIQGQGSGAQMTSWGRRRDNEITSRGAQQGTSYTFSSDDEERAYAKEQAQKEFDEMLEKERRGQSDTSSRRW